MSHRPGSAFPLSARGASDEAHDFDFLASDVQRHVLPNGLTVLVKEVYPASVVGLSIWSRVGSLDEVDANAGISHFLEHMLFKGTPRRPVGRIAQEVHSIGGYLNGFTSYDCTCYWIVSPSRCFSTALDIEVDAILNPLLDPDEIAREAQVIVEELKMYEDKPDSYLYQKLMATAFQTHRYGRPVIGFESVVQAMTAEQLEAHYRRFYRPNNLCVAVVGDIEAARVIAEIEAQLGHLQPGEVIRDGLAPEPVQVTARGCHLEGDITTAHLQMGFHTPSVFHDDAHACDILSSILGEGRSSRLYRRLRERDGMVTGVSASLFAGSHPGLFVIDATLPPDRVDDAFEAVQQEIDRLSQEGVQEHELVKARNAVEAGHVFSQETVEGQGRQLGYHEMLGDYRLAEQYVERLYRVTADDVVRAARTYLTPQRCNLVTYRPRGAVSPRSLA